MWDITVQFYNIVHFTDMTIALKQNNSGLQVFFSPKGFLKLNKSEIKSSQRVTIPCTTYEVDRINFFNITIKVLLIFFSRKKLNYKKINLM
jgi:hypothetical protein